MISSGNPPRLGLSSFDSANVRVLFYTAKLFRTFFLRKTKKVFLSLKNRTNESEIIRQKTRLYIRYICRAVGVRSTPAPHPEGCAGGRVRWGDPWGGASGRVGCGRWVAQGAGTERKPPHNTAKRGFPSMKWGKIAPQLGVAGAYLPGLPGPRAGTRPVAWRLLSRVNVALFCASPS